MNNTAKTYTRTAYMALCGLFAALMAVCSWISIPLGFTPVPVNLGTLGVFLAGALLGPKYGTLSIAVYTLLGAVGVPVFSGFRGGFSVLAGPTGGYILGYIVAAAIIGGLCVLIFKKSLNLKVTSALLVLALVAGLAACYALGTLWFMISTGNGLSASLVMCVIPFLPGDALKIIAAALLISRLRKFI